MTAQSCQDSFLFLSAQLVRQVDREADSIPHQLCIHHPSISHTPISALTPSPIPVNNNILAHATHPAHSATPRLLIVSTFFSLFFSTPSLHHIIPLCLALECLKARLISQSVPLQPGLSVYSLLISSIPGKNRQPSARLFVCSSLAR